MKMFAFLSIRSVRNDNIVFTVNSIKCFQCNSVRDLGCEEIKDNSTDNVYYKDCLTPPGHKASELFCRTFTLTCE